jgi:hypothetical protein
MHQLARLLPDGAERKEFARRDDADLLGEFAPGGEFRRLARLAFALRDRPGAAIAPPPDRAAGMNEEDLEPVRTAAE